MPKDDTIVVSGVDHAWLTHARTVLEMVEAQYRRKQQNLVDMGGNPETRKGDMICHLPWSLLIAMFEE